MISIIGAGPAGSYLAYLLAKKNYDVNVYEEHSQIGIPIQCSGVITPAIEDILPLKKDIIVNKIKKVRFHAPNKNYFDVKIKEDYVFDRGKLDMYIASLAENAGAKFFLNSRFESLEEGKKVKFKVNNKIHETDILVGADGPFSKVAQSVGLLKGRKHIVGFQARAKCDITDKHLVEIYLGYGEFGWLIPENDEIARVGIVGKKEDKKDFESLLKLTNSKILCYQSGMIPLYDPKMKSQKDNVYLIGDAAGMVKGSSQGGILFSMLAGQCLVDSIQHKKDYQSLWKKKIGLDLWLNLQIRNTLKKFSSDDFNDLVNYFSKPELKDILSQNVRDFPSKFVAKMLIKEPRLLRFGFKLLQFYT